MDYAKSHRMRAGPNSYEIGVIAIAKSAARKAQHYFGPASGGVFAVELPQLLPESRWELLIFTMGEVCFGSFGRCSAIALTYGLELDLKPLGP